MATEKRNLIDRDDLIDSLGVSDMEIFAKEVIGDAPTVDAVEVVRCKDCWKSGEGLCSYQLKNVPGKDFCGDGERKDNG